MAEKVKIVVEGYKCERCGYEWVPKKARVRVCPKCHSAYWDAKKKR